MNQKNDDLQAFISELLQQNEGILPKIAHEEFHKFEEFNCFLDSNPFLGTTKYSQHDIQILKQKFKQIQLINQMQMAQLIDKTKENIQKLRTEISSLQKESSEKLLEKDTIIQTQMITIESQKETISTQREAFEMAHILNEEERKKQESLKQQVYEQESSLNEKQKRIIELTKRLELEKESYIQTQKDYEQRIADLQQKIQTMKDQTHKVSARKISELETVIHTLNEQKLESESMVSMLNQKLEDLQNLSFVAELTTNELLDKLKTLKDQKKQLESLLQTRNNDSSRIKILSDIIIKLNRQLEFLRKDEKSKINRYISQQIWNELILDDHPKDLPSKKQEENEAMITTNLTPDEQLQNNRKHLSITYESINIGNHIESKFQNIVSKICPPDPLSNHKPLTHVYIDTQGGARDNSIMLTAILEMLKKSHADQTKVERIYATQFASGALMNEIQDKTDTYKVFDLVSGIDEFLSYMHINTLKQHFDNRLKHIQNLINAAYPDSQDKEEENNTRLCFNVLKWWSNKIFNDLTYISDCMFLCQLDSLEEFLVSLRETINKFYLFHEKSYKSTSNNSKSNHDVEHNALFNRLLNEYAKEMSNAPKNDLLSLCSHNDIKARIGAYLDILYFVAKDNIYDLLLEEILDADNNHRNSSSSSKKYSLNLIKFVRWGLKKDLIQQVLTVIEQRTPQYLYDKGIFHPENGLLDDGRISPKQIKACFDIHLNKKTKQDTKKNEDIENIEDTFIKSISHFDKESNQKQSYILKKRDKLSNTYQIISEVKTEVPGILIAYKFKSTLIESINEDTFFYLVYYYLYIKTLRNTVNHANTTKLKIPSGVSWKKHIAETIKDYTKLLESL